MSAVLQKRAAYIKLVSMTLRVHLFPYRTQKLSSVVPTIVVWRRAVKIGRCQHYESVHPAGWAFFYTILNRKRGGYYVGFYYKYTVGVGKS